MNDEEFEVGLEVLMDLRNHLKDRLLLGWICERPIRDNKKQLWFNVKGPTGTYLDIISIYFENWGLWLYADNSRTLPQYRDREKFGLEDPNYLKKIEVHLIERIRDKSN